MSPWLLVPEALAIGIGLALVFASAVQGLYRPRNVAPTVPLDRLRHRGSRNHCRGPNRSGYSGPGLPADSEGGSRKRFWAILAPFTPDDDLPGPIWFDHGHSFAVPVELTRLKPEQPWIDRPWAWARFDRIREAFGPDDEAGALATSLGTWRTVDLKP